LKAVLRWAHEQRLLAVMPRREATAEADDGIKRKYASAHDLRRAFGLRLSARVMPAILQQLMRHESVETTMRYYVGRDADATADALWKAVRPQGNAVPLAMRTAQKKSRKPLVSKRLSKSGRLDSNQRPFDPQSNALPDCATARWIVATQPIFPADGVFAEYCRTTGDWQRRRGLPWA
jgi:Phage integrase family